MCTTAAQRWLFATCRTACSTSLNASLEFEPTVHPRAARLVRFHCGVDKAYTLRTLLDGRIGQPIRWGDNAVAAGGDGHGKFRIKIAPGLDHPLGKAATQPDGRSTLGSTPCPCPRLRTRSGSP